MGKTFYFICTFSILLTLQAQASSFEICYFKAEVMKVTQSHLVITKLESVVSPGFNAEMEKLRCTGKIKNEKIPMAKISSGKKLLKKGAKIKMEWKSYSNNTPKGPVADWTWKIKAG